MPRHSIIEKLYRHLRKGIDSEENVVYLLVELRKLLEKDEKKNTYPLVNFYGNWVVHTKLDRSNVADSIINSLHDWLQALDEEKKLPNQNEIDNLLWQTAFRNELRQCLESYDLPTTLCSSDEQWDTFENYLIGVIEDCPLRIRDKGSPRFHVQVSIKRHVASVDDNSKFMWRIGPKTEGD